ncbi:MAG: hypothetical protein P9L95_04245, partial [Candidatus Tenebribacter mawsonii]|nr:hypothetical protein [Candidatus Tenebribacter mawsonii]
KQTKTNKKISLDFKKPPFVPPFEGGLLTQLRSQVQLANEFVGHPQLDWGSQIHNSHFRQKPETVNDMAII